MAQVHLEFKIETSKSRSGVPEVYKSVEGIQMKITTYLHLVNTMNTGVVLMKL